MCGIAGFFDYQGNKKANPQVLERMLQAIYHRGPDEQGAYINSTLGLGNVRLSIIDLQTGKQPMNDFSGNFWIVFNGEIFNYIELKSELETKGYHFLTHSDTEVILNGYACWGKALLNKLNGQFAFAIYDKKQEELFLARDRVGICPLFYTSVNGNLIFASEIKAILQHPHARAELSTESLMQLFCYWTPLPPSTVLKNVFQLQPGHYMMIKKGKLSVSPYWTLSFPDRSKTATISFSKAKEELEDILLDSVRIRLRADVPVAAYLSGGIDSTTIVSMIKRVNTSELTTFSLSFKNQEYDESRYQQLASTYFNTNHKNVGFADDQIPSLFERVMWHAESPMLRSAPAPMLYLSEFVRQNNIKVVLTGEGADETLAGYDIFKEMAIRRFWAKQPNSKYRPLLLKKLYPYIPQIQEASPLQLRFFFGYNLEGVHLPYYSHIMRWNNGKHILKYLHYSKVHELQQFDPFDKWMSRQPAGFDRWSNLSKAQYIESNLFMSGYLLSSQGDRMIMANSVEGRYPFLDHRFIEFTAGLPAEFKLNGLDEKYILKKSMENKIPGSIARRPKQAYRAPVGTSFFNTKNEMIEYLTDYKTINDFGVFNPDLCVKLFQRVQSNGYASEIENMAMMAIFSTQLFYRYFIEGKNPDFSVNKKGLLTVIDETPAYKLEKA